MSYHDAVEWLGRVDAYLVDELLTSLDQRATQAWRGRAACRDTPVAVFFPPRGSGRTDSERARRICADCSVRADCLAASRGQRTGIWAGANEHQRRAMRRSTTSTA